jgi:hypothetical protein
MTFFGPGPKDELTYKFHDTLYVYGASLQTFPTTLLPKRRPSKVIKISR